MKIGIVTVYDAITNIGSYLQAYSMKTVLEQLGNEVVFIEKEPLWKSITSCALKINPKRAILHRLKRCVNYYFAAKHFSFVNYSNIENEKLDLLLFGSDEIWNLENPYFKDKLFWGKGISSIPKVAYAVSMGSLSQQTINQNINLVNEVNNFKSICVRDMHTQKLVQSICGKCFPVVCDPTFLVSSDIFSFPCKLPKQKYLLVYSYGVDKNLEKKIRNYATTHNLKIVSAFFWHICCDMTITCSPFEFSFLIKNAECVFTSTFHGAVYTMLNKKRCCIFPAREKVADLVYRFGVNENLIDEITSQKQFDLTMDKEFPDSKFDSNLKSIKEESIKQLIEVLKC